MAHLFEPFSIKGITLRNRIGMSPMCQYMATDGMANDWHRVHIDTRAVGGVGLILVEATAVEARGRITPYDLGLWNDEQIQPLAEIAHFVKSQGAVPGIQLGHAGRKASTMRPWEGGKPLPLEDPQAWPVIGASPLPFNEGYPTPRVLERAEIAAIQQSFCQAAKRALEAGFEWLEIHGAHGYLLHNFYSSLSNQRTDSYGGSYENRIRFILETARAVRGVWPERLPLAVRLSCTDWVEGGWCIEESVELSCRLKEAGVDLIDCSSGGNIPKAPIPVGAGYQIPLAEAIRQGAHIATAGVGLITAPQQADEIVRNRRADIVLLGRELLRNPYWPLQAAQALGQPAPVPNPYLRAF